MTDNNSLRELRFKRSSQILKYLSSFSATGKVVFGILVVILIVTTLIMAKQANSNFLTEVPAYGGSLREGIIGLPRTINPVLAVTDTDRDITNLVYTGLTEYKDGKIVPSLAKSWKISDDGLVYTFILKDNLSFQDGTKLTAEDVVFTIQKIQDPAIKSPYSADWKNVSARVVSPKEVEFSLKQPYAPFLTNTTVGIIPKHIWSNVSDDQFIFSQHNIDPIGTGPYKTSALNYDNRGIPTDYELKTWLGYQGKTPYINNITLVFFSDEDRALAALDSGRIDSVAGISPKKAKSFISQNSAGYKIISSALPRVFGLFLNLNQAGILSDSAVRQALDMSVDRQEIIDEVLSGYGIAIDGPMPTTTSIRTTFSSTTVAKAQSILEKAGWKQDSDGIYEKRTKTSLSSLSFDIYTADSPDLKETAEILQRQWEALGVAMNIKVFEASDLYQNVIRPRKYDSLLFGQFIGKDRDLYAFWHSSQRSASGLNIASYTSTKVDGILEDIRTTEQESELASLYRNLQKEIKTDAPAIFIYQPDFVYITSSELHGVSIKGMTTSGERWNSVEDWYVETEWVWKILTDWRGYVDRSYETIKDKIKNITK